MKSGLQLDFSVPEQFNMTSYFLEHNLEQGRGGKNALRCEGREDYTYHQLSELTNRFGNVLKQLGINFQERILLILTDSPEWVGAWFGAIKIGAVVAHHYSYLRPADYDYLVNYVQPRFVVVDTSTLPLVRDAVQQAGFNVSLLVAGQNLPPLLDREYDLTALLAQASPQLDPHPTHRKDLAFWSFSGGTTGKPKGVPHTHDSLVYGAVATQYLNHYTPNDLILRVPKLFFHYARDNGMNWPMRQGASFLLYPQKATPELLFELIAKYQPTVLVNVPTMMRAMCESPLAKTADLSCLRLSLASGEPLSAQVSNDFRATFGVEVLNTLGSAESNIHHTIDLSGQVRPGSNGKIVPGVDIKILDESGNEVPQGETGVMWVRSGASGSYYFNEPEKSRTAFPGNGWVNTSDLFREDADGYYWCMGRADAMIKVSGVYVSPLEIENCAEKHPAVTECAVMGISDKDGLAKAKVFIVLRPGFAPTQQTALDIWRFCRENIAVYKVPRAIEFMQQPLPKTGQGKIDRQQLLKHQEIAGFTFDEKESRAAATGS